MRPTDFVAALLVGLLGLLLSSLHVAHVVVHDKPLLATVVGVVFPLALSLVLCYAAVWAIRRRFAAGYTVRLGVWTALGAVAITAVVGTITAHQLLAGHLPADAGFQLATAATGGALGGFLVGVYDVRNQRRADRIEALQRATSRFVEAETHDDVCELIVDLAASELEMPFTAAWLYDEESNTLDPVAITDDGAAVFEEPPVYRAGEGLSWEAFENGSTHVFPDLREEPGRYNEDTPVRSEMILPLGTHGVLNVGSREPDAFDDVDVSTAKLLASAAGAVLDRVDRESELRSQRRALERQNDRLEEFSSIVSHDLRNPLSVAQGYLEVAQDACDSDALAEVEASHQRMEVLISDLLAFARADDAVDPADVTRVDLEAIAWKAWGMVDTEGATLEVDAQAEGLTVLANASRLQQVLENLFRNALEHGPGDRGSTGDLTVRVTPLADDAGFAVEDDGVGIPPTDRQQVFDSGYSTRADGTGLGLGTVERICESHGWTISVTDSSTDGARFEIRTGTTDSSG
ncbi:histidine kinase [Natrarchaeobaculum aegyptiacum]|uniref:histidine kinase n=1 Tax=Natrarchaeobaculum aegyptiacum TaxID=745377 RepID=A0A2Z2HYV8_9EURY|nr:histidine kinase [Natrarchaeobaculum aegyptiacum]